MEKAEEEKLEEAESVSDELIPTVEVVAGEETSGEVELPEQT